MGVKKVIAKNAFSSVDQALAKPFQVVISASPKVTNLNISVLSLDGKSITIFSGKTTAKKETLAPAIRFAKSGIYTVTIREGSSVKTIRVSVK